VRPFDLARPPLLRLDLAPLASDRHLLRVDIHHIITDGSSHAILLRDLLALYAGEDPPIPRLQYQDYAVWQQRARREGWLRLQEEYWLARFAQRPVPLELPTDFPRPQVYGFAGQSLRFALEPEVSAALRRVQAACGATSFTALLAIFAVMLHQYTGQEDMVIGAPVNGRTQAGLEEIIGMFVNLVALRCRPVAEQSFAGLLAELNQTAFEAFANQDYPFEDLVSRLGLQGGLDRNPLCNVLFSLQNLGETEARHGGLTCRLREGVEVRTHFDLTLLAVETPQTTELTLVHSPLLFSAASIQAMTRRFLDIARRVSDDPGLRLGELQPKSAPRGIVAPAQDDEGDFGF
jgi:hypothetical protein